jgi:hypothetical protein
LPGAAVCVVIRAPVRDSASLHQRRHTECVLTRSAAIS